MLTSPPVLLGSRQPRVKSHPQFTQTLGPEAVELAGRAGLIADPWQADVMDVMLALGTSAKWAAPEIGVIVSRQSGKGAILEIRAFAAMFLLNESLVMWSAHEYKTAMEAFRRLKRLFKRVGVQVNPKNENLWSVLGFPVKFNNTNGEEGFERLDTEQRIQFIARSKGSGRGFTGDVNIIDEAFAYTAEQQNALMPTTSAVPNAQLIYTSSPPLDSTTAEPMFNLKRRGERGDDPDLAWFDWGAPHNVDVDDRDEWARSNPALGIRISMATLERNHRSMTAAGFATEHLGVWPETADDRAISTDLWSQLETEDTAQPVKSVLMIDVSPDRRSAAIVGAGVMADSSVKLRMWGHWPNTSTLVDQAVELNRQFKPDLWVLHGKSSAAVHVDDLAAAGIEVKTVTVKTEDGDEQLPVRGSLLVMTPEQEALAWGRFVDMVRQRLVWHHAEDAPLNVAVAGAKTRPVGAGSAWARRGGADITALVAATGATWAAVTVEVSEPDAEPAAYWI